MIWLPSNQKGVELLWFNILKGLGDYSPALGNCIAAQDRIADWDKIEFLQLSRV